jgi:hypothetical protein
MRQLKIVKKVRPSLGHRNNVIDGEVVKAHRLAANTAHAIVVCIDRPEIDQVVRDAQLARPHFVCQLYPPNPQRWRSTDIPVLAMIWHITIA